MRIQKRSIYQDRLGTKIGKVETREKEMRFLAVARRALIQQRAREEADAKERESQQKLAELVEERRSLRESQV